MISLFTFEGSGFTICLGIILILTGIVMYYSKTKIAQTNHKVDSMFGLVTELHEEITRLKTDLQHMKHVENYYDEGDNTTCELSEHTKVTDVNKLEQDDEEIEESEDDEESDDDEESEEKRGVNNTPLIANSFLNHPYNELIPRDNNIANNNQGSSSESEDDTDNENDDITNIKIVDLGEIEELSVDNLDDDNKSVEETPPPAIIDYSSLKVPVLKSIANERKLSTNVNKLRKSELIKLLESSE